MFLFHNQELKQFTIYRSGMVQSSSGRVLQNQLEEVGQISGVLAVARPEEISRWNQLAHPVTHKVVVRSTLPFPFRSGDVLKIGEKSLIVSAEPYDVGGLGHFTIIYCNERSDLD